MKAIIYLLLLLPAISFCQTAKEFITQGVALHDKGQYKEAIEIYKKALAVEKDNQEAIYEVALSSINLKDYPTAIEYADKLIKAKKDFVGKGYHLKGMSLDYSGKPKEAIDAFKKGIKAAPDYTTLYYSLALTSYQSKDFKTAEETLHSGILKNNRHASSHYMLGLIKQDERSKSLLALYYFLLTEPNGQRANNAYNLILSQHKIGVEVKDEKTINININPGNDKDGFGPAEMMLSMLEASKNLEDNKGKSEFVLFSENTKSFFMVLGELQENSKNKGFWWDFYVDFFYSLAKNEEMYKAFTYYITQDVDYTVVQNWLQSNPDKIKEFEQWVANYKAK
ncbi:tetratricopeptide repeat protein [Flavobacterium sp. MFBS3-15]|uniref:tetratricopeptide repeat protein n=1 Tax=Flavobacterium sp. MFBS3-15 TaxID=2989816 RepID=UPI0022362353|nr:tetratricopeptide repeat protein [Flavobacterium sp. MFBS3-15]MCW4467571.1 tetratricopeptide repeat protein [Flavobacterium sp. MFBS3-15]